MSNQPNNHAPRPSRQVIVLELLPPVPVFINHEFSYIDRNNSHACKWEIDRMQCSYITGKRINSSELEFRFISSDVSNSDRTEIEFKTRVLDSWTPRMVMVLLNKRIMKYKSLSLVFGIASLDVSNIFSEYGDVNETILKAHCAASPCNYNIKGGWG